MEIVLIRHTSVDVPPGVCYGQTDVPLKPSFEQEAAVTKENLKVYLPFEHVYTSPAHTLCTPWPLTAVIRKRNVTGGLWRLTSETGK